MPANVSSGHVQPFASYVSEGRVFTFDSLYKAVTFEGIVVKAGIK